MKGAYFILFKISFKDHGALHMFEPYTNENMCIIGVIKHTSNLVDLSYNLYKLLQSMHKIEAFDKNLLYVIAPQNLRQHIYSKGLLHFCFMQHVYCGNRYHKL